MKKEGKNQNKKKQKNQKSNTAPRTKRKQDKRQSSAKDKMIGISTHLLIMHIVPVFMLCISNSNAYMMISKNLNTVSNVSSRKKHILFCHKEIKDSSNDNNLMKNNSVETLKDLLVGDIDINSSNNNHDIEMDIDNIPEKIRSTVKEMQPSDIEIRLNLMGFNALTFAGFLLAAILLFLNNVLGTGWAGDLLSRNLNSGNHNQKSISTIEASKYNRIGNSPNFIDKSNERYIIIEGEKIYLE